MSLFVKGKEDGFTPGENGYTVEFRVKTDNLNKVFEAFAVTPEGAGFKAMFHFCRLVRW